MVKWVIDKCAVCAVQATNKGKPPIKPIKTRRCLDRIQIDLMDFRSQSDGEYKWILQIKDTFSRYIWLYALKDKSAELVMDALVQWFGQNGSCSKLYV
jgi:transposase InsO family protein